LAVFARYSPQAQSLTIGQQFTPQLQFVSCGGDKVETNGIGATINIIVTP
jgi:hypothetical protein